jgi:azurin
MTHRKLLTAIFAAALSLSPLTRAQEEASGPPTLTLDKSPVIVNFQLKRHTNAQLVAIDRNDADAKFKPVYMALLTRKGLDKKYREEGAAALAKLNKSDPASVLLEAIAKVPAEDKQTPRELAALLMAQKPAALAAQREKLETLAKGADTSPTVKQAAYAALATADGKPDAAFALATDNAGVPALLAAVPTMPAKVRETFYAKAAELAQKAPDAATQAAALEALGSIPGKEADAFKLLAHTVQKSAGDIQAAAVRAVGRIPASKWPKDQIEPLAVAIVKLVEKTPSADRTKPAGVQVVQVGNDLAAALPPDKSAPIRKQLRDLAPRVVVMHTLHEQMMFDVRYFTVQAGKPVQIILDNSTDTMPHNVVITAPGALQEIALIAGSLTQPEDPKVKAFVPENPKVLHATHLVPPGESETLSFEAPAKPGNYPFLCSYPGHWVKMYGVMQVVPDLDEYDKNPTAPKDPMTRKPFESPKNEGSAEGAAHNHEH